MVNSLNAAQAKLLADYCSDLSKGLILAGVSIPFTEGGGWLAKFSASIAAIGFAWWLLLTALELLERIKE